MTQDRTRDRGSGVPPADSDGASTLDLSGRCVGSSYILVRPIGEGATGTVWQGVDRASGEPVAVKLLHESLLRQPKLVTRFVQERTILLMLRHRNVVRVRDLFSVGATLGLVMDFVEGGSLRDHLRENHTMAPGETARLGAQVAAALTEAHGLGIVHRDLKPDNILLRVEDGRLDTRLTDFGIARMLNAPSMTTPNAVVGTPHYMAPEAFHGATPSPATDVYALGVVLYEMVSGRLPYTSDQIPDLMRQHMNGDPERRSGIPEPLWELIAQCMALKPRLRPTAGELVGELSDVARDLSRAMALPPAPIESAPIEVVAVESALVESVPVESAGGQAKSHRQQSHQEEHPPSLIPLPRQPQQPKPRNQPPRWRWVRPGATTAVIAGAMALSAVLWNLHRDGTTADASSPPVVNSPAAHVSHVAIATHRAVPHAPAVPTQQKPLPQATPQKTQIGVRPTTPAPKKPAPTTRKPVPEARPYGPWQCAQGIAFDLASKTAVGPEPCQMVGRDIQYKASLAAPGGAVARIQVSLQDTSGRTVAGPRSCTDLQYTGAAATLDCGPFGASPARGHQYKVVMNYHYERGAATIERTAMGSTFAWS